MKTAIPRYKNFPRPRVQTLTLIQPSPNGSGYINVSVYTLVLGKSLYLGIALLISYYYINMMTPIFCLHVKLMQFPEKVLQNNLRFFMHIFMNLIKIILLLSHWYFFISLLHEIQLEVHWLISVQMTGMLFSCFWILNQHIILFVIVMFLVSILRVKSEFN